MQALVQPWWKAMEEETLYQEPQNLDMLQILPAEIQFEVYGCMQLSIFTF